MRKFAFMAVLLLVLPVAVAFAKEPAGRVTMSFDLGPGEEAGTARLWVPYPVSNEYQEIGNVKISGNHAISGIYREPVTGAMLLYAQWDGKTTERTLQLAFDARGMERSVALRDAVGPMPPEVSEFLHSTRLIPTDGEVGELAEQITKGKQGTLAKARAVYEWVVENTYRDPSVKGCGLGIVEQTLARRGGKCADISTVFVALARAAGVPARDVFGMRLGKKPEQDISTSYNCWAEFYLPGVGWVPVNPADVRKKMLVEDLTLKEAAHYIEYYFGSVDPYRILLVREGRDVTLTPPQEAGPLNYFMYPYAELDGRALDYMDHKLFSYSIRFKAL